MDTDTIGACVAIVMGTVFALGHKTSGTRACRYQERILKRDLSERGFQLGYLVSGIGVIAIGVYVLVLRLLHFGIS